MDAAAIRLDHVGLVVPDLAAAAETFTAMGFRLTPEQRQEGPVRPDEPPTRWGSANRCAMLAQGYVEILGLVDPSLYDNQLGSFLARGPGIHILAFEAADAEAEIARLAAAGVPDLRVHPMRRPHRTPSGEGMAGFKRVPLPTRALHGGRVQFVEHETPDLLWHPDLLTHPNRAQGLMEVMLRVDDPASVAAAYAPLLAAEAQAEGGDIVLRLGRGRLVLSRPDTVAARLGGIDVPPGPDFVAFTVATADRCAAVRSLLAAAGTPFVEDGTRLVVPPDVAGGAALVFA